MWISPRARWGRDSRKTGRQPGTHPAAPIADLGFQAHPPDGPRPRKVPAGVPGANARGKASPLAALGPSPCPFSAPLASLPVSAFPFLRKDWRWVAGAFPSERGCEFRVWGGILSEPRRPGPPRARSEGQTGRLGGEETPSPGGARSGVRRAYLRQPSPCRTL